MKQEVVIPFKSDKPFSSAIATESMVFVSGQGGIRPDTGEIVGSDLKSQTAQTLDNIRTVLKAARLTLDDIVKTTVYLSDPELYGEFNELYRGFFHFIKQELDKALQADIALSAYGSADDYQNQLNVRMASGNLPDLFGVNKVQIQQYQKQNLLLDLTPYLDKLQPVIDFIGENTVKKGMIDGKVYAIPKAPGIPSMSIWIRKDWLDNLKLDNSRDAGRVLRGGPRVHPGRSGPQRQTRYDRLHRGLAQHLRTAVRLVRHGESG